MKVRLDLMMDRELKRMMRDCCEAIGISMSEYVEMVVRSDLAGKAVMCDDSSENLRELENIADSLDSMEDLLRTIAEHVAKI